MILIGPIDAIKRIRMMCYDARKFDMSVAVSSDGKCHTSITFHKDVISLKESKDLVEAIMALGVARHLSVEAALKASNDI